jgi:diaminopimelate decarboxylase
VKANSNLSILKLIAAEGMGFDVVSKGELYRVIKSGADPKKVVYSGVGKTKSEIRYALENNILCFNVESEGELLVINEEASYLSVTANISIRVNPDVAVESHPYISTGMKDNKFGITYNNALALYIKASKLSSLNIIGIDFHIGSQITSIQPYLDSIKSIRSLVSELKKEKISITHIDVGGGLGISYEDEDIVSKGDYIKQITNSLKDLNLTILFEPGRSVIGDCGLLVTKLQYIKESETKNFMIVDASMSELLRPPLYDAFHKITPVIKRDTNYKTYDIVGPVCESADFLGKDRLMNSEVDDYLVIEDVGAYGFVLSSNYNTRPKPAEYIITNGNIKEIRSADTLDQILENEL